MNKPHSLVIVSKALAPYRVRFYSEVAKALLPYDWKVTLVVSALSAKDHPWKDPGKDNEALEILGVGRTDDSSLNSQVIEFLLKPFKVRDIEFPNYSLLAVLEQQKADVVWTHEYSPFCLAAAFWASLRDRYCLLSSDLGSNPPKHSCTATQLKLHKAFSFLYQGVIAQTKEATRRTHPKGAPINFAPHAIDTDLYFPDPFKHSSTFRFLFAGGIRKEKGIITLIEAGRLLALEGKPFEVRIVGTGPLFGWLADQSDSWLSIGGFIEGENLQKEYRSADAYILPTEGDTYGVTIHEAAASGLPLIVGKTAGAVETLLYEGISGFAIDAGDIQQLADRMRLLLSEPSLAKRMGIKAREAAEILDVKSLGKQTADFIRNLTESMDRKDLKL